MSDSKNPYHKLTFGHAFFSRSLHETGDGILAEGKLKELLWRVHTFGLSLTRLDIRQVSVFW